MLIWLGKSLLPVPTILAPAAFASSGIISGSGLAIAKITASLFMLLTMSASTSFGLDRPKNISAPLIMSRSTPLSWFGLLIFASASCSECICLSPSQIAPFLSQKIRFLTPKLSISLPIAQPAAPAPLIITLISSFFLPVSLNEFISAARAITAVPCWSS